MNKEWYKSKAIWIAALQGVAGILIALSGVVHGDAIGAVLLVKTVVDIIIRALTTQPLGKNETI